MPATIHVWVNPPDSPVPRRAKTIRFAIGTPHGLSSDSWKAWVHNNDAYFACRDDLREFKVSLHASNIWRLALTEEAVAKRPDLLAGREDRLLQRWHPTPGAELSTAFQLVVPPASLHRTSTDRAKWSKNVMFLEPAAANEEWATIVIIVTSSTDPVGIAENARAVVFGILPLADGRTVQLLVVYERAEPIAELLSRGLVEASLRVERRFDVSTRIALFGERGDHVPWMSVVSLSAMLGGQLEDGADHASEPLRV